MNPNELEALILDRCDGTEWHLSLWYPRVSREVIGIPRTVADSDVQRTLFHLIEEGRMQVGSVDGADFRPEPFIAPSAICPDLYVRAAG